MCICVIKFCNEKEHVLAACIVPLEGRPDSMTYLRLWFSHLSLLCWLLIGGIKDFQHEFM